MSRSRCAPRTLAISQRRTPDGADLAAWAQSVGEAGVEAVQIREKDFGGRRLLEVAESVMASVRATVAVLINGRVDVAIACGAAGVHLPATGLPVALIREHFPELLIGVSTHRLDEIRAARDAGADYVVFGPVFAPTSKAAAQAPLGLEALAAASSLGVPVLALGGVTLERLAAIAATGAAGVAAIGAFRSVQEAHAFVAVAHEVFPHRAATGPSARPVGTAP